VKPVVLTIDPLVAVTNTVETPVGVPASGGGLWIGVLLLPPPHPGATTSNINVRNKNNPRARRFPLTSTLERSIPTANIHSAGKNVRRCKRDMAVAAFVVMVMEGVVVLAVPFAVIVAGAKTHVASEGRPEQANVIVPLKLVEFVTLTDVVPDPPGAAINTVAWVDGIAA